MNQPDADGQRGVIVNAAPSPPTTGRWVRSPTPAAKAAILGMTLPLARDLAPLGLRVCGIAPGTMGTDVMLDARAAILDPLLATIVFPQRAGHPAARPRRIDHQKLLSQRREHPARRRATLPGQVARPAPKY